MNETTIPITEGDGWKDVVDMAAVSRTHHFVVAALPNPNVILWTIDTKVFSVEQLISRLYCCNFIV
jgi:hypothetical protein